MNTEKYHYLLTGHGITSMLVIMQVKKQRILMIQENVMYDDGMSKQLNRKRPVLGNHLLTLRKAASLSQQELADILEVKQQTIAFWEQGSKPPRSEVLPKMAKAFGVKIDTLISATGKPTRQGGPTGKAKRLFERVSRLPRRQQQQIIEVVEALVDKKNAA